MAEPNGGEHAGHRKRLKKKFLDNGLDIFDEHQTLELLLFYAIPRKDTNPLAHRLIKRYGSFGKVCDAPLSELMSDFGLSESAAILLKMQPELARLYSTSKSSYNGYIEEETLGELVKQLFIGRTSETVALILGDARGKMVFSDIISKGSVSSTDFALRKMVALCVQHNAVTAFVAHNHPSGSLLPSEQDLDATMIIAETMRNIGVRLMDHYIVTDTNYLSLKESGMADYLI